MCPPQLSPDLKKRLRKTWSPFFGRFGRLNPLQDAVIPYILAGENVIVSSPAATGKTEAVCAPLIERIEAGNAPTGPLILYIAPTRALVNNISLRLNEVVAMCGLRSAIRTGDRPEYSLKNPEHILFTTPESLDSMLCRLPHIWKGLKAVILDEIHLLDGGFRGDQLRVLLERIRREHASGALQYAALSATVFDPQSTALRYFTPVTVIKSGEQRPIRLRLFSDLKEMIDCIKQEKIHKVLIFTNSRRDVEELGAKLRELWPRDRILLHHGSLSKQVREASERNLREWRWGICVATMTLEIGIDIGDFDAVICYHPPFNPSSFQQRIGRGCRREEVIQVIGYCASEAEEECFRFFTEMAQMGEIEPLEYEPDISVAVQQIFSSLFACPKGKEREQLEALISPIAYHSQFEAIVNHLTDLGYITSVRERLFATGKLMDLGEKGIIHSNIPSSREYRVVDSVSGAPVGEIGLQAIPGTVFVLGGRVWEAMSFKGRTLYARPIARKPEFKHFRKKSPAGAFTRFLPEFLRDSDLLK